MAFAKAARHTYNRILGSSSNYIYNIQNKKIVSFQSRT
jgi:hypothetical protein